MAVLGLSGALIAEAEPQVPGAGRVFRDCSNCPEMVVVPAGSFLMGESMAETERDIAAMPLDENDTDKLSLASEHPQHKVTVAQPFAIGRYFVTRGEFAAFVEETAYKPASGGCVVFTNHRYPERPEAGWESPGFTQTDRDPVVCVSWTDAQAYVAWLNSKIQGPKGAADAGAYHLPSEAEWEYAARAGTQTVRWWGDTIGANNADCEGCGSRWDDQQPAPVGSFRPNPFGIFEMLGSAWQWTQDCWNKEYAGAPTDGSPGWSGNYATNTTLFAEARLPAARGFFARPNELSGVVTDLLTSSVSG